MSQKTIKVKVYRFTPNKDKKPQYETYNVALAPQMSVLAVLDYIYENLDNSLAFYSHSSCHFGLCGRCTVVVNGKPSLACQTEVKGNITLEPLAKSKVIKDLVVKGL